MSILLETDSRKRVSLARLGVEKSVYFLAEQRADGSILLVPAEVRPKAVAILDRVAPDWREDSKNTEFAERDEWTEMSAPHREAVE